MKKVLSLILVLAMIIMPMNAVASETPTESSKPVVLNGTTTALDTQTVADVVAGETGDYYYMPSAAGTYTVTVTGTTGFTVLAYDQNPYMASQYTDENGAVEFSIVTDPRSPMGIQAISLSVQNNTTATQSYTVTVVAADSGAGDEGDEGGEDGAADITEIGTYDAPVELTELGAYNVALHESDGMTFLKWTATEAGTFTVTSTGSMGGLQIYSIINESGEDYVYGETKEVEAGDVLLIKGEGMPGYVVPVTFEFESSTITITEIGTDVAPVEITTLGDYVISLGGDDGLTFLKWTATETGTLALTYTGMGMFEVYSVAGETPADPANAAVEVGDIVIIKGTGMPGATINATFAISAGSSGDSDAEGSGTMDDPYVLTTLGEITGTVSGGWGTYFAYTATESGTLKAILDTDKSVQFANVYVGLKDGESVSGEEGVALQAGQTAIIELGGIMDGDVVVNVTFTEGQVGGGDDDDEGGEGGNGDVDGDGTWESPYTLIMGDNTVNYVAWTTVYFEYVATANGSVSISMKTDECTNGWAFDAYYGDGTYFAEYVSSSEDDSALTTIPVNAGDVLTIAVYTPDMAAGTVKFSAFFIEGEGRVDGKEEFVTSDTTLVLGDNNVTLDPNAETTGFEFTPDEVGTYKFEVATGLLIGDWNASYYPQDKTENKTNTLEAEITSVGQSIFIGVTGEGDCTIKVSKVEGADVPDEPVINDVMYDNKFTPVEFELPVDADLVYVNVTDGKAETAVLGADGFYHLNSADGPILFIDLGMNAPYAKLIEAYGYGQLKVTVLNADGSYTVTDYSDAVMEYYNSGDGGLCVLTEDLIHIFKELGNDKGWYDPEKPLGFYLFTKEVVDAETEETTYVDIPCDANAWMFACAYVDAPAVEVEKVEGVDAKDSSWTQDSKVDVVITIDADIDTFKGLYIDGKEVAPENYTVKAGSIIITLKASYLDTLKAGDHTVAVVYNNATVTNLNLTVVEAEGGENPLPEKGDVANTMIYVIVLMGAALVAAGFVAKKKFA